MRKILLFVGFVTFNLANAQVGIGTTTPNPSSLLDLNSSEKGLLLPRI